MGPSSAHWESTVTLARDSGLPIEYPLAVQQAAIDAAVTYICPQCSRQAADLTGFINMLSVLYS